MINFLCKFQNLRSGMIAHRFNNANKDVKKAMDNFGLTEENCREVAMDIFVKPLHTLNTLTTLLLDEND